MINFTEANRWAKSIGYKIFKKDELFNWVKTESPEICGNSNNLSLIIKQIYNDYTDNKWVDHQNKFSGFNK